MTNAIILNDVLSDRSLEQSPPKHLHVQSQILTNSTSQKTLMSKRQRKIKRNRGNSASRVSLQNLAGQVSETVERSIDRSSYEDSMKKGRGRSQFSQYIRGVHSNLGVTKEFELGGGIMK